MDLICKDCFKIPDSHSFKLLCTYKTNDNILSHLFYTKIADSKKYNDTSGIIKHYENYLNFINPINWTWIIDFGDFEMKHSIEIRTSIELSKLIKRYNKLDKIIVINQNIFVKAFMKLTCPFLGNEINKKIYLFNSSDKIKLNKLLTNMNLENEFINFLTNI